MGLVDLFVDICGSSCEKHEFLVNGDLMLRGDAYGEISYQAYSDLGLVADTQNLVYIFVRASF
jgi:hypothetical protein